MVTHPHTGAAPKPLRTARMDSFSDGVFSIAATLLVLDLAVHPPGSALEQVLEQRDQPYQSSIRIWEYQLRWAPKRVTRRGYLFFGAPNERATSGRHPSR